jgi:GT2 family glycosyltransferase
MSADGAAVTIIIVGFNSRPHFAQQKMALEAQTVQGFSLIYWDNASEPTHRPSPADLMAGAILVQSERNLGFAGANNQAAAMTQTPYIVLLNPDAFPEPEWLERLLAAAARYPHAASIGSTQRDATDAKRWDGLGDAYHAFGAPWRGGYGAIGLAPQEGETFSACAAAALYRRTAWEEAGGFEERFFCFGEDVDLGFRLRLLGHGCVQAAAALVAHQGGASAPRRSAFALYHGRRNRLWTYVRCMPLPLLLLTAPAHAALTLATFAASLGKPSFLPTWRALIDGLADFPALWAARRRIQATRRATIADIARALTWSPIAMITRHPVIRPIPDHRD